MAEESFPFQELAEGDRTVSAALFAKHLGMIRTRGVIQGVDNVLALAESSPQAMSVDLDTGAAFVGLTELRAYRSTLPRTLTIAAADPTDPRHDLVVLDLDTDLGPPDTRRVTALVLQGAPDPSPSDPSLTQTESHYQFTIARVVVPAAAAAITNAEITDLRTFSQPNNVGALTPLDTFLEGIRDTRAWLCFSDFSAAGAALGSTDEIGIGLLTLGGPPSVPSDPTGGALNLATGTSSGVWRGVGTGNGGARPNLNPRFACKLKSNAGQAEMDNQSWGFGEVQDTRNWDIAGNEKVCFRSITTGNLFAATSDPGGTEETTDLSAFHTLGTRALFEIRTTDGGVTWEFLIDEMIRATHSTNVPNTARALFTVVGIGNNTTVNVVLEDLDFMYSYQNRT